MIVNFQEQTSWMIHTIAQGRRTPLGPYIRLASKQTMLRLFRYLGATDSDLEAMDQELRQWNRGGVNLEVPEDKLKLLRVNQTPAAAHAFQPKSSGSPARPHSK